MGVGGFVVGYVYDVFLGVVYYYYVVFDLLVDYCVVGCCVVGVEYFDLVVIDDFGFGCVVFVELDDWIVV